MSNKANRAKIHIAKKDLGIDDDTYRAMIRNVGGAESGSSNDLTPLGWAKVFKHLEGLGWKAKPKGGGKRTTPNRSRIAMVKKIRAILAEANRPDKYADGMAKNMFKVDRYEWCDDTQLRKLIAALTYDQKRRKAREGA